MPDELIHDPGFNWDAIPEEDRPIYAGFQVLMMVAFKTTRSECITVDDDEILEVMRREMSDVVADVHGERPVPGGPPILVGLVAVLIVKDLVRMIPDASLSSGRRLVLYFNPATGEELWRPPNTSLDLDPSASVASAEDLRQLARRYADKGA